MSALSACAPAYQKRAADPTVDCESPSVCWELNWGRNLLEEQVVLLTTEPYLQPHEILMLKKSPKYVDDSVY